ncbi:MAG: hypothetical protein V2A69_00825 [Pseudomonadota bacterium]
MPVKSCTEDKKKGWKWGNSGKCYVYPDGDEDASNSAKQKAYLQGAAVTGGKMTEDEHLIEGIGFVSHSLEGGK